jgi:predicted RNA methylase
MDTLTQEPVGRVGLLRLRLFVATFAILLLELAMIRWTSHQVRLFAYLNNVLLISAFLGMGLGVAMGARRPGLIHWTLPSLAALAGVLSFSDRLGLLDLGFPDASMDFWGLEPATHFAASLARIVVIVCANGWVFVCLGAVVGEVFSKMESLSAYSIDLAGSAAGVVAMTALAAAQTTPVVWFAAAGIAIAWLSGRRSSLLWLALVLVMVFRSIGPAQFSPYYRIDLSVAENIASSPRQLSVNRDFHQYMLDLSAANIANEMLPAQVRNRLARAEEAYRLPFMMSARKESALILGAGTGNDVAAALRAGFRRVDAVDIDPLILELGEQLHPEAPYGDPRVRQINDDARAYLERTGDTYDVVAFGLLDSHAVFSAMSSLRLDNFVYTREAISRAWTRVAPDGVLSLSFSVGERDWLADRMKQLVIDATGIEPVVVFHGIQGGRSFVVAKGDHLVLPASITGTGESVAVSMAAPRAALTGVKVPTDDWPFLYLRPDTLPLGYIAVLLSILVVAVASIRGVFGSEFSLRGGVNIPMFFLGAAFLLIETRGVTDLSLLFGSTWIVNSAVFFGVLVTVWVANEVVRRVEPRSIWPAFACLLVSLAINYMVRPSLLLDLPMVWRWLLGGLLNALPIGCAGLIFSTVFRRASNPAGALGANLLGAVFGGSLEYFSMAIGLRALTILAACLYVAAVLSLLLARRTERPAAASVG